ncbi:MAG: hypothetical protein ACLR6B_20970 [Blautia sp.]
MEACCRAAGLPGRLVPVPGRSQQAVVLPGWRSAPGGKKWKNWRKTAE